MPTIIELALAAIQLATDLAARAHQSGELTDEQRAQLRARAYAMFDQFSAPPKVPK